jgi:hypothetical protein
MNEEPLKKQIPPREHKGHYLGTEINEKWWKRYTRDHFLARGMGHYWFDGYAMYFHRLLLEYDIVIPYQAMKDVKIGHWHAGKWCMHIPVLKIIWEKDGLRLSSGFVVSNNKAATEQMRDQLKQKIAAY